MIASHLRSAICSLFTIHKTDQYALADNSNLTLEQIMAWMDSRELMTLKDLVRLARAFNLKGKAYREAHAQLLYGYLKDHCVGPGSDLIFLELLPTPDWIITSYGRIHLRPRLRQDLEVIHRQIDYNPKVIKMLRLFAEECRQGELNRKPQNL